MRILVDIREPEFNKTLLEKNGFEVDYKTIDVGDYVYDKIVFERKEMQDFISSATSGHLDKQLIQMTNNYDHCFLIIIGEVQNALRFNNFNKWSIEKHIGFLSHINSRFPKIRINNVGNNTQAMNLITKTINKLNDGKTISIYDTELLRNNITTEDEYLRMLCGINGISIKKAKLIQSKFPSLILFANSTKEQLIEIDGIGDKIATHIIEVIK